MKKLINVNRKNQDVHDWLLPRTIQQCLDAAAALDTSASTVLEDSQSSILGATTQPPSEKVQNWIRTNQIGSPMRYVPSESSSEANKRSEILNTSIGRSSTVSVDSEPNLRIPASRPETLQDTDQSQHSKLGPQKLERLDAVMQDVADLVRRGRIESAKNKYRKLISELEFLCGINDPNYKQTVLSLAALYQNSGDIKEADQLRDMVDQQKQIETRNEFKELLKRRSLKKCVDYAFNVAALLYDTETLTRCRHFVWELTTGAEFSEIIVLVILAAVGNSLLVQLMLSRGISLRGRVNLHGRSITISTGFRARLLGGISLGRSRVKESVLVNTTTVLESAVIFQHYQVAQLALENDLSGYTELDLHICIQKALTTKDVLMVKLLLANGANPNFISGSGSTLLARLAQSRNIEMVKVLLENGANPKSNSFEALSVAVGQQDFEMTKVLLDKVERSEIKSPILLDILEDASLLRNVEIVRLFSEKGVF
jgi:hypothetical protein